MVGTTTRQFDYESGWLPNKEWASVVKGHLSKDKAIQMAKENVMKLKDSLNESKYVDKDIEPLGKELSQHSDDGFIDFCTAKVLDDLNKGNKEKLDFFDFWNWTAEVGSKDIVELIYHDFKNDKLAKDSAVCKFYNIYEKIKDLSLKDPKKFIKLYGWAYKDKIKDKDLKKELKESHKKLPSYLAKYGATHFSELWEVMNCKDPIEEFNLTNEEEKEVYKSEILEKDSLRLKELENNLFYEKIKNPKTPSFEDWKESYLKPAYGLTCHKLQGSTIKEGQIFVHIDDLICAMMNHLDSYEEKARLFQKYLYVAFSRATSINQLNLFGSIGISKKNNKYVFGLTEKLMKDEEFGEEFFKIIKHVQPMYDPSIRANCKVFEDYDEALQYILDNLDYSDDPIELEGEKEWREKISKAHSGEHKRKYNDEFLRNISKEKLYKMTRNAKIRKRWNELNRDENTPCNSVMFNSAVQNPAINLHANSIETPGFEDLNSNKPPKK